MTRQAMSRFTAAAALIAGLAACSSAGTSGQSSGPAPSTRTIPASPAASGQTGGAAFPAAAWGQFGGDTAKSGVATGLPAAGQLSVAWRAGLDGAVYGQPLVVGQLVIAATENDSLYGLDRATGHVAWRTHLGSPVPLSDLPCGNIDPLGITGTPAYDRDNGLVYALAEMAGYRHVLFGLTVSDGAVKVERDIPAPDGQPRYDQQRPALTIEDGRAYMTFGGLYGDCGPYVGSVVGVPLSGSGALVSYKVPTAKGGAIWGTAGPVAGPGGTLYVSAGNGAADGGTFDGSDSVTALSPDLKQTGIFAPVTWGQDNASDLDLGSTQPALLPNGTLLSVGKRGTGYLLRASHLGGVGGQITLGPGMQGIRGGGGQRDDRLRAVREQRDEGREHRREPAPGALDRPLGGVRLAGARRGRGLGEQLGHGNAVRAEPGERGRAGLGQPGGEPAALRVGVAGRVAGLRRHERGCDRRAGGLTRET